MAAPPSVLRAGALLAIACLLPVLLVSTPARASLEADSLGDVDARGTPATDAPRGLDGGARDSAPERHRQPISFIPRRFDQCVFFMVTEASAGRIATTTQDAMDEYLFTDGIGLMMNVDPGWAVGGGIDLHLARGALVAAPTLRCRRWFAGQQSVEAALGVVLGPSPNEFGGQRTQLEGPIASARYSPTPEFFLQGGVCRFHEQQFVYVPTAPYSARYVERTYSRAFAGIGLSGRFGAAAWGVQLLGIGLLVAMFSGMD